MIVYRELKSIETDLGFSIKTLYGLSNNLAAHYHSVLIPKKDETARKLSVPDKILKRVQKSIADNLLFHYPVSRYSTAYSVGDSVQGNAARHVKKSKILKLDIDGFFDHISYSLVKDKVFFAAKYSEPIRILLAMLCYFNDALPQGAPTSPAITNIIMYDFDETIGAYCSKIGVTYTRYCDDMTFSGDFNPREIIRLVKTELKKLRLFLKDCKTKIIPSSKRQVVTGVVVNEKLNLTRDYKKKIRREIYFLEKFGVVGHLSRIGTEDKEKYLNGLKGRVAYVLQTSKNNKEFLKYKSMLKNISLN